MSDHSHDERWPNLAIKSENFKCFVNSGWISLKPLTIFLGRNNSGKSSAFQPLLLLKQSSEASDFDKKLNTKGPLHNFGGIKDIAHFGSDSSSFNISVRYHSHDISPKLKAKRILYNSGPGLLEFEFSYSKNDRCIILSQFKAYDVYERWLLTRNLRQSGLYGIQMPNYKFNKKERSKKLNEFLKYIKKQEPSKFLFDPRPVEYYQMRTLDLESSKLPKKFIDYLDVIGWSQYEMKMLLNSMSYIGPLREHPKRYYELSDVVPNNVGTRGEFAPELIYLNQGSKIIDQLNKWIKHFGIQGEIKIKTSQAEDSDNFSLHLLLSKNKRQINLADLGFGISQLLPILVEGLTRSKEATIILEQPEIHLNPKLQSLMADFFVDIVKQKKRFIIETHSEHLLLRIRSLVAQKKISPEDIGLYFVERNQGVSSIKVIPLEEDGHIESNNWPKGFFEDSLTESINLVRNQINNKKNKYAE